MKKLYFALVALMLCAISADAATVYLKPNSNWLVDNARFAAYYWNNSGNGWVSMEIVEGETSIYSATIPDGVTGIIFCRMNPNTTANNWDNKWNQTGDLTYHSDKLLYTVPNDAWDSSDDNQWSSYTPPQLTLRSRHSLKKEVNLAKRLN